MIVSLAVALTITPFVLAERMPANVPVPLIVIPLVMVTVPKPPGSRTEISPPFAVFEMAPAKVLHGAVRLHGFTSSPTPETQVRVACAYAPVENAAASAAAKRNRNVLEFILINFFIELT